MMQRSKSGTSWMQRHVNDPYVQQAQREHFRSRASYKLLQIQEKYQLLRPGMTVCDLGAAPGGWSQVAIQCVGDRGKVIAIDILTMDPLAGVDFLQGDFTTWDTDETIKTHLHQKFDVILSDMAPNLSGNKIADQASSIELVETALDFALQHLKPSGSFLVKLFQGEGVDNLLKIVKNHFQQLKNIKPMASRSQSREIYLLASGLK